MITSVYIAAPYTKRDAARGIAEQLQAEGFDVTASWLFEDDELSDAFARKDLADIERADALVALNPPGWAALGSGGKHVELGYAFAKGKPIVLVGERTNIFHYLSSLHVTPLCDLTETLRGLV